MCRDPDFASSISTVGRILEPLVASGRVQPLAFYYGRVKPKRWRYGIQTEKPGESIQIDHMSVSFGDGFVLEAFKATSPLTATTMMRAYCRASRRNARRFLEHLITQLPYPAISIQVDGGSAFKEEFKQVCQALEIPLFVLPPKKT